jgi:hypothetical protein
MDIIATRQAVEYARRWAVEEENGPLLLEFVTYRYGGHSFVLSLFRIPSTVLLNLFCSMSDPGTTYRTREEVQRMRSTQDPIRGLQRYIEDWGLATEQELKVPQPSSTSLTLPYNSSFPYRHSIKLPKQRLTPLLKRLRLPLSLKLRTSGQIFTTRVQSRRL